MHVSHRALSIAFALGVVCLLAGSQIPATRAQNTDATEEPAPPWELTDQAPGEPYWAGLLRLRAAESKYRDTKWWGAYAQMRAYMEAGIGNHAAALAAWDWAVTPHDSVGALPPGTEAKDAVAYLSALADTARVIMINERHHAASDRLLTLAMLPVLREKGFRYFAAEAFDPRDTGLNERNYPVEATGTYVREPVFAEVVREAIRLGYTLVPYESMKGHEQGDEKMTRQQRRDYTEAYNLAQATVKKDPDAKILVHAGYSHVLETPSGSFYPMAAYFREATGIDPVTVDQTRLSERSEPAYENPAYRACVAAGFLDRGPAVLTDGSGQLYAPADFDVDVQVFTPRTHYTNGRPDWMSLVGGREAVEVDVPEGRSQWCVVEARAAGEPDDAVPLDRCELDHSDRARIFLPPNVDAVIRIVAADGSVLRTIPRH